MSGKLSAHHRGGITESMEDYLECIDSVIGEQGFARVSDIAEHLDIRSASVSIMIKRLAELGFVNHIPYRGFTLTPKGKAVATHIAERHATLETFFQLLRLPQETLQHDVEGIEHHVSADTLHALSSLITFWNHHPSLDQEYTAYRNKTQRS